MKVYLAGTKEDDSNYLTVVWVCSTLDLAKQQATDAATNDEPLPPGVSHAIEEVVVDGLGARVWLWSAMHQDWIKVQDC